MNKVAGTLLVAAVVGGGFFFAYKKWPDKVAFWRKDEVTTAVVNRPTTATISTRNISFAVTAAGDIGPAEQVSVRPEINGRIKSLPVDIGDKVKKGAILFTLDDQDLQIERSSRVTEIESSQLQLERSKRNYERSEKLFSDNLIAKELFEDSRTEYELAKNALERSKRDLELVEDRLTKTKILAPFDCTVLTRPVSIGQAVSGSSGFNSGTEVLSIADLSQMIITAHINQADVIRLKSGQPVDIEIEAVPGLKLQGHVDRIAPQATIKNGIKGFATRILLRNAETLVRPGMTANLNIPLMNAENVLAIPLAAVFTEQNERFAYVKTGNSFEKRIVQLGVVDYDFAEVQNGLAEGEVVSLMPPSQDAARAIAMGTNNGGARGGFGRSAMGSPVPAPAATNATAAASTNTPPAAAQRPASRRDS